MADLAKSTAAALRKSKTKTVRLGYDAGLFGGPAWNPAWPSGYGDQVTPVSALWVDEGRVGGGSPGPRASDPARDGRHGVRRGAAQAGRPGHRLTADPAPRDGAAEVASVSSMPLERIVEQVLMVSDNDAAEVLFRHVAVAQPADRAPPPRRAGPSGPSSPSWGLWRDGTRIARRQRAGPREPDAGRRPGPDCSGWPRATTDRSCGR